MKVLRIMYVIIKVVISKLNSSFLLFVLFNGLQAEVFAQEGIVTKSNFTAEELVRDIFVKGSCDNVSNIQTIGKTLGIGYFENGENIIGINQGIILSSGDIEGAEGPNGDTRRSGNFRDNSGDRDLRSLVTGSIFDAVGLEFDFVPLDSSVAFRYVFASEEYCEFVGREFNDVFGFFVSGPGIEGTFSNQSVNVALIPGSEDFVAINSVNHQTNSDYYISNIRREDANTCGLDYQETANINLIEYDGFTAVLEASLNLIPCETYHIRFVVADVGDNFYDSAVFLEAGSFNLGGEVELSVQVDDPSQPYIVEEGCQEGFFLFERANTNEIDKPITVRFNVSAASTAVEGVDFDSLPDFITIPANVNSATLPISIINDLKTESLEFLTLELDIPCACYTGLADLIIKDPPVLFLNLDNQTICNNETILIEPDITGGTGPFTFNWEDGVADSIRSFSPTDQGRYSLTITDACGNFASDDMVLGVKVPPSATITGVEEVCEGDTARLRVDFDGLPPYSITFSCNNVLEGSIDNIQSNPFFLPATKNGNYLLEQFSDKDCEGMTLGEGEVITIGFQASWEITPTSCFDSADGQIEVEVEGGNPPFQFDWGEENASSNLIQNLAAGNYPFTITDNEGCDKEFNVNISSPAPIEDITFDCEDLKEGLIKIETTGGIPPYLYSIDRANYFDENLFQSLAQGESYNLYIQDSNGCIHQQDFTLPVPFNELVELDPIITLDFGKMSALTPKLNIPENLIAKVKWTPADYLSCTDCLEPTIQPLKDQLYSIKVEDIFGCTGSARTSINVKSNIDVFIPTAFSPNNDNQNDQLTVYANEWQISNVIDFQVFDRWGNLLFQNQNFPPNQPEFGWNGKIGGQLLPNGIYVVLAKVQLVNDQIETIKGQSLLMK